MEIVFQSGSVAVTDVNTGIEVRLEVPTEGVNLTGDLIHPEKELIGAFMIHPNLELIVGVRYIAITHGETKGKRAISAVAQAKEDSEIKTFSLLSEYQFSQDGQWLLKELPLVFDRV